MILAPSEFKLSQPISSISHDELIIHKNPSMHYEYINFNEPFTCFLTV